MKYYNDERLTSRAELLAVILRQEIVKVASLAEVGELDAASFALIIVESEKLCTFLSPFSPAFFLPRISDP